MTTYRRVNETDLLEALTDAGVTTGRAVHLNDVLSFDAYPVRVLAGGIVEEAEGEVSTPEMYLAVDDEGHAIEDADALLIQDARSEGWEMLTGYTGQYGYRGPVMHASELIGGAMAYRILTTPGIYAAVVIETDSDDEEPAGWSVLYRAE